jgi:hypothetical protein
MQIWKQRHAEAASDFCELMLKIRDEGALNFQHGMWSLWQAAEALDPILGSSDGGIDPTTTALYSDYHNRDARLSLVRTRKRCLPPSRSPYGTVSERWLLSFEAMARQIRDEHFWIFKEKGSQAAGLRSLFAELGPALNGRGTQGIRARIDPSQSRAYRPCPLGLALKTCEPDDAVDDLEGSWAILPLVWLPLSFYVRNTSHLYEMLKRLQQSGEKRRSGLQELGGAEGLRGELDRDPRRYSFLVFAITAALQALLLAKADLCERFPWRLLASNPPDACGKQPNGYPMMPAEEWSDVDPIFRGIWIGNEPDEERTLFQYSFQSFSREVTGVLQVLSFYASVPDSPAGNLAAECNHVLFFVSRVQWCKNTSLAIPVQLFEGPKDKKDVYSEMEVLLPPYVRYELEDDLSLSSADFVRGRPSVEAQTKLRWLANRWGGFKLPDLLMEMLKRNALPDSCPKEISKEINSLKPFISVRFIRSIHLVEPLRNLFTDPDMRLYDFTLPKPQPVPPPPSFSRLSRLPPMSHVPPLSGDSVEVQPESMRCCLKSSTKSMSMPRLPPLAGGLVA